LRLICCPEQRRRGRGLGLQSGGGRQQFMGGWEEPMFGKHVCHALWRHWDREEFDLQVLLVLLQLPCCPIFFVVISGDSLDRPDPLSKFF